MMKLEEINSVYFVGIGGIGMSAIARWFKNRGANVAGYDRVKTPLTSRLEDEGMWIHYEDKVEDIPVTYRDKEKTVVVYTPAIPKHHRELSFFNRSGFEVMKRSEILGVISRGHYTIAVAGTHGKTTTSSMISHLLNHSEQGCSAFVGGVMTNYDSNLIIGDNEAPVVVEADEFDRSFHRLSPNYAVITSVDPDHLDIYGDEAEMRNAFGYFAKLVDEEGKTLVHYKAAEKINAHLENLYYTYGIDSGDIQARALRAVEGSFIFNYHGPEVIKDVRLEVPGFHNVENAVAAITVALNMGMDPEVIRQHIADYRGVKRRFEYIIKDSQLVYIDDYAHHPTEITAFLKSVKALYPRKKVTAIFQPHLFSRTKDFQQGFAESLDLADEIILLDIYPAREEPISGITSQVIFDKMIKNEKTMCSREELMDVIKAKEVEVLCTIGAGDIDQEVQKLKAHYLKEYNIEA